MRTRPNLRVLESPNTEKLRLMRLGSSHRATELNQNQVMDPENNKTNILQTLLSRMSLIDSEGADTVLVYMNIKV